MENVSRMDMRLHANCLDQDNGYHFSCNGFRQLILSGVRIEYNDQLTRQGSLDPINVYNSSTTTLQNSGMCSNGNQNYHSFSVKIYFANITGSFRIYLTVRFQNINDFRISQAVISGDILIYKGKISSWIYMWHMYFSTLCALMNFTRYLKIAHCCVLFQHTKNVLNAWLVCECVKTAEKKCAKLAHKRNVRN